MDKKKIISSLTMAGLLATSVAGASVYAADTDPETKALGEYSKLITGKVAVPFMLTSEEDSVTGKDLKASFPNKTVSVADDAVLKTGDVVYVNGSARTIVIYGDTNCDGKVNIMDAVTTLNHVKEKAKLEGAAFAAADLNNNGSLNILEAVNVLNVVKGKTAYSNIASTPASETPDEEKVAENILNKEVKNKSNKGEIKLTFDASANGYTYKLYNDTTKSDVAFDSSDAKTYAKDYKEVTLKFGSAFADGNTYVLTVTNGTKTVAKDTFKFVAMKEISSATITGKYTAIVSENQNSLTMDVVMADSIDEDSTVTVTLKDTENKEAKGTATLKAYAKTVTVSNFSGVKDLKDGKIEIKVEVKDKNGNISVKEYKNQGGTDSRISKNTRGLEIVDMTAVRDGNVTLSIKDGEQAKKAYYMIRKASDTTSAPSASQIKNSGSKVTIEDEAKVFSISSAKDVNADSLENVAYKIYVLVESAAGVESNVAEAMIASTTATSLKVVVDPKVSSDDESKVVFEWTDDENKTNEGLKEYKIVLYKVVDDENVAVASKTTTNKNVDFTNEIKAEMNQMLEDKTLSSTSVDFKVGVTAVAANTTKKDSAEVVSAEYAAKALIAPTAVKIDVEDKAQILKWTDSNAEGTVENYKVNIYKYDEENKLPASPINNGYGSTTKTTYDLTEALSKYGSGKYAVTVVAVAPSDRNYVSSLESGVTANSITYFATVANNLSVELKDNTTASVEMKKASDILDADKTKIKYTLISGVKDTNTTTSTELSTLNSEDKYTANIEDLESNKTYNMYVLVEYKYDGTNFREIARTEIKTVKTEKAAFELTTACEKVSWNGEDKLANANTIACDNNNVVVYAKVNDSKTVIQSTEANHDRIYSAVKAMEVGDKIQTTENGTALKITNTGKSADYKSVLSKANDELVVEGAATISATDIKKITVNTTNVVDLTGVKSAGSMVLNVEDAKVDVAEGATVEFTSTDANQTVTINSVAIKLASKDTKLVVKATANGLDIVGTSKDITVTATGNKTVNFSSQTGNVTVAEATENKRLTVTGTISGVISIANENNGIIDISGVKIAEKDKGVALADGQEITLGASNNRIKVTVGAKEYTFTNLSANVKLAYASSTLAVKEGTAVVTYTSSEENIKEDNVTVANKDATGTEVTLNDTGKARFTVQNKVATVYVDRAEVYFK